MSSVQIAYIGNFEPEHSTENDVRRTLIDMGHHVVGLQEQREDRWRALQKLLLEGEIPELILWTRTASLSNQVPEHVRRETQYLARMQGVPMVGFHLDRWWGLTRWHQVLSDPFFRCDFLFTADGGHQPEWQGAGVNHYWSPPAIAPHNVKRGTPRAEFKSDIAFVGNWQGGYHPEWTHREHLLTHLRRRWGKHIKLWPRKGEHAVRGDDLADLYASVKVVVGDSCLVPKPDGSPMTHYCSDRVFETIGRGGLLVHPFVDGVTQFEDPPPKLVLSGIVTHGEHLLCWDLNDWGRLDATIEWILDQPEEAERIRKTGFEHVAEHHTYRNRLEHLLEVVFP
jgi:hypothetical protein